MTEKFTFTSYKDTRGNPQLGREILEAFGLTSQWMGSIQKGPISLVELREGDGVTSVTAHSKDGFAELVVLDAGKTLLKETSGKTGLQIKTTLWPNGKVEMSVQDWNDQTGLMNTPQEYPTPNGARVRQRVQEIARRILPLVRKI